jgi:hypothetical protein
MKHLYQLEMVEDLADGEISTPEPGMTYELRSIDEGKLDVGTVIDVIRQGGALYARTTKGDSIRVTGHGAAILVPDYF